MAHLKELFAYKELLYMITWREIKIKYKQSIMGLLWAIFMPLLIISAGILVKLAMAKISGNAFSLNEIISVSIKALPWAFFISSVRFGTNSLITNTNLVTKIYFPKEIFPIAAVFSQLFDFIIAACCLTVFLIIAKISIGFHLLVLIFYFLILFIFTIALSLVLSAMNLYFRDVKYLVEVFVTFAIFFTPVFYEASLAGKWEWLILLNPVAVILEAINSIVLSGSAYNIYWILYSLSVSLIILIIGYSFFKVSEPKFAEII